MQKHLVPVNYAAGTSGNVVASGLLLVPPRVAADARKEGGGGCGLGRGGGHQRGGEKEGRGNGGRGDGSCSGFWWQGSRSLGGGFQEEEIEGGEVEVEVRKASPSQHGAMV